MVAMPGVWHGAWRRHTGGHDACSVLGRGATGHRPGVRARCPELPPGSGVTGAAPGRCGRQPLDAPAPAQRARRRARPLVADRRRNLCARHRRRFRRRTARPHQPLPDPGEGRGRAAGVAVPCRPRHGQRDGPGRRRRRLVGPRPRPARAESAAAHGRRRRIGRRPGGGADRGRVAGDGYRDPAGGANPRRDRSRAGRRRLQEGLLPRPGAGRADGFAWRGRAAPAARPHRRRRVRSPAIRSSTTGRRWGGSPASPAPVPSAT